MLGALLFAIDHFIVAQKEDPLTIVVGSKAVIEARQAYLESRGREPNADELDALGKIWLDNELLYREGLALQLDQGDRAIRERVIFKALSVIDSNLKPPPFDEQVLRQWFEANRAKYDEPVRFDFLEAALSEDTSETAVRSFVVALNSGTPGDAKAGLRVFKGRPQANVVQSYGPEFTKLLAESPVGEWRALQTREGWRAIQLQGLTPGQPADFIALRGVVLHDWTDAMMAQQRTVAVRALAKKYTVKYENVPK
ncbi:MAG: peptidyl-prolyl cis-trans isomerase [Proteobacteria bacterium]|nr:peptidyl-prolyl cis-trans isomerase [Burkholderiales bacterium]